MLKLQFRDRRRESVWLVDKNFTIGKATDNSLIINDSNILDHHIQITNTLDKLTLDNISSSSSVLLNDKPVANQATLKTGDHISIAGIDLELIDPKAVGKSSNDAPENDFSSGWSIFSNASWLEQNRFLINGRMVIGRDPSCDITLPLEHLSRKHVALEVRGNQLHLEDLGSSNGTYLNGRQVKQAAVNKGDKIKIDVLTFEVSGPAHDPNKTIIRTAAPSNPDKKNPGTSRLATKIENPGSNNSASKAKPKKATQPQTKGKPKATKKNLVSEGKQEWISGKDQTTQQSEEKSSNMALIAGTVIILTCCAAAGALIFL